MPLLKERGHPWYWNEAFLIEIFCWIKPKSKSDIWAISNKKAMLDARLLYFFTVFTWPVASNFKSYFFGGSLEQFFLTVGQNNFGNKIPFIILTYLNEVIYNYIFTFICTLYLEWVTDVSDINIDKILWIPKFKG